MSDTGSGFVPGSVGTRPAYDSPAALRALLEAEGLAMSKRLGQNFLVSPRARERVFAALRDLVPELGPRARLWEIGPGIGAMTAMALDAGFEVVAFELDHGFSRLLGRVFAGEAGFRLVEGDFLKTWSGELVVNGPPLAVFGNLPYNVANAMVAALIERYPEAAGRAGPPPMAFTVQKEAAHRICARPGSKDYSAFSVLCASASRPRLAFDLAGASFWPVPNVTSSVVLLAPRADPLVADDRLGFSAFVRAAFASRRKTLKNNLKAAGCDEAAVEAALAALGHAPAVRAEALSPEELAALYERLAERRKA